MTRMADSFHNMSASYMTKTRPTEFITMQDYINNFSDKLGVIDRISQRVVKEQYGRMMKTSVIWFRSYTSRP